jgi:hypothetical protein
MQGEPLESSPLDFVAFCYIVANYVALRVRTFEREMGRDGGWWGEGSTQDEHRPTPTKTSPLSRLVNVLPCTAEMSLVVWDVRFLRHMKPQLILGVVYNETRGSLCLQ